MTHDTLDSLSFENQQKQAKTKDNFDPESRMVKKFLEKFPSLDLGYSDNGFLNPHTQQIFEIFKVGWLANPYFSYKNASIVGKLTDRGLDLSTNPNVYLSGSQAEAELNRLETKHPEDVFAIFQTVDQNAIEYIRENNRKEWQKQKKTNLSCV